MREESLAVREKAVALAEKNAAALGSVSSNIKQAQAISKRQGLARRQVVINGDPIDARNLLHTPPAQAEESNDSDLSLPPLDSSVRSSVVGEKGSGQPATDGSRRLPSVVVAATVSGSPMNQPQPQQPVQLQSQQLFSVGAAQNIVSAVLQMGFTLQDQDTFTAVLVEKVTLLFFASSRQMSFPTHVLPNTLSFRFVLSCNTDPVMPDPETPFLLPNFSLVQTGKRAWTCIS